MTLTRRSAIGIGLLWANSERPCQKTHEPMKTRRLQRRAAIGSAAGNALIGRRAAVGRGAGGSSLGFLGVPRRSRFRLRRDGCFLAGRAAVVPGTGGGGVAAVPVASVHQLSGCWSVRALPVGLALWTECGRGETLIERAAAAAGCVEEGEGVKPKAESR